MAVIIFVRYDRLFRHIDVSGAAGAFGGCKLSGSAGMGEYMPVPHRNMALDYSVSGVPLRAA